MRVIIERVSSANVKINNIINGEIGHGYLLLVGFTTGDNIEKIDKMAKKIVNLRIFADENGKMNRSIIELKGSILSISQFTLYANTDNGRRPSFEKQLNYEESLNLYHMFNEKLRSFDIKVEEGIFGEHMVVDHINDGPVTIILEE